ncbi:MAG: hypothetical protein J5379_10940 [Clostridiales bacterium]|nr:hypothetical protein [Clostridiales bacterium]
MKRDIIGDIFLGGVLLSLLFLFSFPAYFCFSENVPRAISLNERLMSIFFVMGFIMTCIWFCWKKKVWVMAGVASFGLLAYIPKWFLPKVNMRIILNGRSIVDSILSMILNRIYELTHAPFTGLLGMVPEKTVEKLPYVMLPLVIISYIVSQIIRFYHNAYVTEKKQMHDFAHYRKNVVRAPKMPAGFEREAPSPLGTVVLNEKSEIAKESFPVKTQENEPTIQHNLSEQAPAPAIPAGSGDTAVIALAAHAPTSKPSEETQVIALSAHAPTSKPEEDESVIALSAHAPTSKDAEETKVIALSDHAPSSAKAPDDVTSVQEKEEPAESETKKPDEGERTEAEKPDEGGPPEAELDFPDVHGEAEKIDVFGDDDLP